MTRPFKKAGFQQGIYQTSSTAKETLGTLRILQDGRKFRYAKAGANNLSAGKVGVAAAIEGDAMNESITAAVSVGEKVISLTLGGSLSYDEDYFKGGFLQINDAAGEGRAYPISGSTEVDSGTAITVTLEEGIKEALTTSSEYTLVHSPWMAVTESTTEESLAVGVAPVDVTANYYYWAQTGGPAICLISGSPAVGTNLTLASTAGAVTGCDDGVTSSSSTITIDNLHSQPIIGVVWGTTGVDTEYKPIFLKID